MITKTMRYESIDGYDITVEERFRDDTDDADAISRSHIVKMTCQKDGLKSHIAVQGADCVPIGALEAAAVAAWMASRRMLERSIRRASRGT